MNNPLNFSPSELLSVWLDGELDQVHEAQLFSKLAGSAELRREMRELLAIHQEIDSAKFYPPAHLKAAAMGKAGLGDKLFPDGFFSSALPAAKKLLVQGGLMAAGSALTLLFLSQLGMLSTKQQMARNENKPLPAQLQDRNIPAVPEAGQNGPAVNTRQDYAERSARTSGRTFRNNGYYAARETDRNQAPARNEASRPVPDTESSRIVPVPNAMTPSQPRYSELDSRISLPTEQNSIINPVNALQLGAASGPENFSIGVRGMAMRSYPAPITQAQADPFFNDMSVTVLYKLGESHRIGVEAGQETFSQEYSGTEMTFDGLRQFQYRQNLLLPWAGISYEFAPGISGLDFIRPLGRLTLGGSDAGMVGRFIIGTEFSADSRTRFLLGLEGAALMYTHQQQIFLAPKLGISYGVSVGF